MLQLEEELLLFTELRIKVTKMLWRHFLMQEPILTYRSDTLNNVWFIINDMARMIKEELQHIKHLKRTAIATTGRKFLI